jgi:hypothetical protein
MKSIILFMPYYGKLPNYFDIWLQSVKNNNTVDFCIISDLLSNENLPSNVQLINISFDEFKQKVQEKFDFKISLENYGRISQFRPALAYIFPEKIKRYDYWGYIECDLIPGDIRAFITDDVLETNDKIFKLGHFQIFRNNQKMNQLFMFKTKSALDYKFAFGKDVLFFEELLGMHNIANAASCKTYEKNVFADIKCYELMFNRSNYGYNEYVKSENYLFSYENGKLFGYTPGEDGTLIKKEVLYVHLQKRGMEVKTNNYNEYLIIPNQFVEYHDLNQLYFEDILKHTVEREDEYRQMIRSKLAKASKDRNRKFEWWMLRLIRFRIRKYHGVDLDGK